MLWLIKKQTTLQFEPLLEIFELKMHYNSALSFSLKYSFLMQLSMDWFHPDEPSCKRSYIQRLIHDILQNRSCENSPSGENESCVPFNPLERGNHDQNAVEFISDHFGSKSCHGDLLCPQTSQGFEMNRLSASSLKNGQCPSSSGLVLRDSFEPESNLHAQIVVHFDRSISFSEVKNSLPSIEVFHPLLLFKFRLYLMVNMIIILFLTLSFLLPCLIQSIYFHIIQELNKLRPSDLHF